MQPSTLLLLLLTSGPTAALRLPLPRSLQRAPSTTSVEQPPLFMQAAAEPTPEQQPAWVARINKISTFASILCAIDCTVFPVLLALLPIINIAGGGASVWLHNAAHAVALYFVAPVGGAAVVSNALQHRKPLVLGWGSLGVSLVLLANVHLPHSLEALVPNFEAIESWLHARHSMVNVFGCGLLLSSQWYSHRLLEQMGKCCGHEHGHSHDH